MADLASLSDVAVELGFTDETAMSENQQHRALALISRVSDLFSREAQREFAPGTSTVRLRIQYETRRKSFVRLSEPITSVSAVVDDDGNPILAYTIKGDSVFFTNHPVYDHFSWGPEHQGNFVTVTYDHDALVPGGVRNAVAAIVARYIALADTVGGTAQPGVNSLSAGEFSSRFADWVSQSVQLTPEDKATARGYRYPASLPIIVGT